MLLVTALLLATAPGAAAEEPGAWELTLESSWPAGAVASSMPPTTSRLVVRGGWGRAFALLQPGDPSSAPLAGADLGWLVVGPAHLAGALSELRDPWSLTGRSGALAATTGLELDASLEPTTRRGVQLRVPLGAALEGSALLAAREGHPSTTALLLSVPGGHDVLGEVFWLLRGVVAPEQPGAWVSDAPDFPGGPLHHFGVRWAMDRSPWHIGASMAAAAGERSPPGALIRLTAGRHGVLWESGGLLLVTTPGFFDHDGRAAPSAVLAEVALRRVGRFLAELAGRTWFGRGAGAMRTARPEARGSTGVLTVGVSLDGEHMAFELVNELELAAEWNDGAWLSDAEQRWRVAVSGGHGRVAANVTRAFATKPLTRLQVEAQAHGELALGRHRGEVSIGIDGDLEWVAATADAPGPPAVAYGGALAVGAGPVRVSVDAEVRDDRSVALTGRLRLRW